MPKIQLSKNFIRSTCKLALNEDLYPSGDITTNLLNNNSISKVNLISNEKERVHKLNHSIQSYCVSEALVEKENYEDHILAEITEEW